MLRGKIALRGLTAAAAAGLAFSAAACGGAGATGTGTVSSASQQAADAEAKAAALMTLAAMKVYAIDRNGSYSGASARALRHIEPRIPKSVEVDASRRTYTIIVPSTAGGNTFRISRAANGTRRTCKVPGEGGCPVSGNWD